MTDQQHMQPQDAFAELARITLADHSLDRVMDKVAALAKSILLDATEVSVTLVERGNACTVAQTGNLALELDERQYERGYGPCLSCIDGGAPLVIADMRSEQRWPDWARSAADLTARSSMSIPVPVQREVSAALNVYSTKTAAFDDEAVELASTFAAYAAVALANMHLHTAQGRVAEQMRQAMQSRAVIEQAKGILMGQRRCSTQEAFDLLVRLSQDTNRKLRVVAAALVEDATGQPAG